MTHSPDPSAPGAPAPPDGAASPESRTAAVDIDSYHGDRAALRPLFEEAEDSAVQLDCYLEDGEVLVARVGGRVVGHLQLVGTRQPNQIELKPMAVTDELRGTGIGRRLVEHALAVSRARGRVRMIVATAAADIDNLRFYQRRGFRFERVERDAFGVDEGYAEGIVIDGIPLLDRVWLSQDL